MVFLILAVSAVIFQATHLIVTGDELTRNPYNDEYDFSRLTKRYLAAMAKNKQLPIQERAYPPMISPYAANQKLYDEPEINEDKRYLGALARSGDLNFSKPQQKKNSELENEDSADEYIQNKGYSEELPNPRILKLELIDTLKPIILQYIDELKKEYDPRKVNLFLENLANAVFDRNEEFTLDNIKSLVRTNYFQPEEGDVKPKRNIQSLVRDYNVSFGGTHRHERHTRDPQFYGYQYDLVKRNLESLIKNKLFKRYVGAMAKNYDFPVRNTGKRDLDAFSADLEEYLKNLQAKRHTMYDINEPDITFEYPSQVGEQTDYNDYAEQMGQDAAIPIGKRYLGALARSGWLPRGFADRTNRLSSTFEKKRHIGALAKLGWLSSVNDSPNYYYRGGRGRDFKPPSFRGPRAYFLKADTDPGRCQCKRSLERATTPRSWLAKFSRNEKTTDWSPPEILIPLKHTSNFLAKDYLFLPNVKQIFRSLYPHLS